MNTNLCAINWSNIGNDLNGFRANNSKVFSVLAAALINIDYEFAYLQCASTNYEFCSIEI